MSEERLFTYVARDQSGRQLTGRIAASTGHEAYSRLQRQSLAPVSVRAATELHLRLIPARGLRDRDACEFTADLASLLAAGADIRTSLGMLGGKAARPPVRRVVSQLIDDISAGESLSAALARRLDARQAFVSSLVSAGESGAGLASGLERSSEILKTRLRLKEQLITSLSYPAFVLFTSLAAVVAILLLVVPALQPLVEDSGANPPIVLQVAIAVSQTLRDHGLLVAASPAAAVALLMAARAFRFGASVVQRLLLDGPAHSLTRGLVFGGFSVTLGSLLTGGSSMNDALKLSIEAVSSSIARARLDEAHVRVRQGMGLSQALALVTGFPTAIARLAAVGEASGALGGMLSRAGKLEEERAVARIEALGKLIGPALIVGLGAFIGLLMASLLSGISQLGAAATQ